MHQSSRKSVPLELETAAVDGTAAALLMHISGLKPKFQSPPPCYPEMENRDLNPFIFLPNRGYFDSLK